MIKGIYSCSPIDPKLQRYGVKTTVEVSVENQPDYCIKNVEIEGRPEIDEEWYKKKEGNDGKQIRHVNSIALIKEYLDQEYTNKPLFSVIVKPSEELSDQKLKEKAKALAHTIFKKYKKMANCNGNLFVERKDENEGGGKLLLQLEAMVRKGRQEFCEIKAVFRLGDENGRKIIAFLNQTEELKRLITTDEKKDVHLKIDSWEKLCFLYENTLIDYKGRKIEKSEEVIAQGQTMVDRLYLPLGFDTSLRKAMEDKYKKEGKRQASALDSFIIKGLKVKKKAKAVI